MKQVQTFTLFISLMITAIYTSCKKETSCEGCNQNNKSPLAMAGPDQVITLPTDSVLLDGSASSDPDGKISAWLWTKISGPASFAIVSAASVKTTVRSIVAGVYQFELLVKDDGGLSAKDTVQVMVDAPGNQPPIACAGADQTITLPVNTVTLDGSCSTDPDNNITAYVWTKIAGPSTFTIATATAVKTGINNLTEGTYQFVLKVTDAGGLSSDDTVQVTVQPANSAVVCIATRHTITAQLVPIGKLSKARVDLAVASAGTKVLIAGGIAASECPECWGSPQVDIYDTVTKTWTTAKLSEGRWGITAVAAGNKIFFAGGEWGDGANDTYYTNVDIYDASSNSWSVEYLTESRSQVGAAVLGDKVFFAGGVKNLKYDCSNRVDIYNLSTTSWSTAVLSMQRAFLSAVSVGDKVYFAGGSKWENRGYSPLAIIDIYDNRTNTWATSKLSVHSGRVSGAVLQNNIYWSADCPVEIRNAHTNTSKLAALSRPGGSYSAVKNDRLVVISGGDRFDIYDSGSDKWFIGRLPRSIEPKGNVVSVNNTIYLTDGDQVYKLVF